MGHSTKPDIRELRVWDDITECYKTESAESRERLKASYNDAVKLYPELPGKINELFRLADPKAILIILSTLRGIMPKEDLYRQLIDLIKGGRMDLYDTLGTEQQVKMDSFVDNYRISYEDRISIDECVGRRVEEEFDIHPKYIPVKERVKNRIVLCTGQILQEQHAPSAITYDFYNALTYELGMDTRLVVFEDDVYDKLPYYDLRFMNSFPSEISGYVYDEHLIPFTRSKLRVGSDSYKTCLKYIEDLKPEFILDLSCNGFVAYTLQKISTVASMHFGAGYPYSTSPILLSYMESGSSVEHEYELKLKEEGRKLIPIIVRRDKPTIVPSIKREDYNLPEDSFLICIAGNRLDDEMDDKFLEIMHKAAEEFPQIYYCLVGDVKRKFDTGSLEGRIIYLGYRNDYYNTVAGMDLMLNPDRPGGGSVGTASMLVGIPIVTKNNNDAAAVTDERFWVRTYGDYLTAVRHYLTDKDYYDSMCVIAHEFGDRIINNKEKVKKGMEYMANEIKTYIVDND